MLIQTSSVSLNVYNDVSEETAHPQTQESQRHERDGVVCLLMGICME